MRLYMLELGRIDMDRRVIMPASPPGERIVVPVPGYLVQTDAATILIDSGMPRAALSGEMVVGPLMRPLGGEAGHVVEQLRALGVAPGDLTQIVATHFHFDHGGGLPEFPGVPIVAQRAALDAARVGRPGEQTIVGAPGLVWQPIEGDYELVPGVRLLATPGHAVGHQSVLVEMAKVGPGSEPGAETRAGSFLLAIDAIYSSEQLAADDWGAYVDPEAARASARRVRELAARHGATLVYGHDAAQWAALRHAPAWYE